MTHQFQSTLEPATGVDDGHWPATADPADPVADSFKGMSSQQLGDELLAVYWAERRERELFAFYEAERNAGADVLLANERMHFFAKHLDEARDLSVIKQALDRT